MESTTVPISAGDRSTTDERPRHTASVRLTHWLTTICFFALLVSGVELIISHPRFYWGEAGNMGTKSLFDLPIPASRSGVHTGYDYTLPDQNGWSRYLHFQSAWLLVFTAGYYGFHGIVTGHFRKRLLPRLEDLSLQALAHEVESHFSLKLPRDGDRPYNLLQRLTYLLVIFILFPLMIWTGLAMSPAFTSAFPLTVTVFGGQQSARTIHFFITLALVAFVVVHIAMVCLTGFKARMRAMITGSHNTPQNLP